MTHSSVTAADQFAALGLTEAQYTPAMRLAVTQRWSNLPITEKTDDLRARLAGLGRPVTMTAAELHAAGFSTDVAECEVEAARLRRNAGVSAWRTRKQLQAALDARILRYSRSTKPVAS